MVVSARKEASEIGTMILKQGGYGFDKTILKELKTIGYKINETRSPVIGKVDGILILENGTMEGGADRRGDDTAIGF
ncbi:hypothetical protein [Winogradskyella sp.]|jgi:gamma-glutamyltranspeptidase/glutathione hydrolase|uniref:hypothetical protein n=1 Tax=Winogradskyella sp. TaxID=1883156 RepID=UPI0025D5EBC9|nr:hypothetical protein [Winogradskyella sp.]MCT4630099.1 hypothetical protein [Winogradskyella sp.]